MCLLEALAGTAGCLGVPLGEHSSPALAPDTVRGQWAWTAPRPYSDMPLPPATSHPLETPLPFLVSHPAPPAAGAPVWLQRLVASPRPPGLAAWPSSSLHPWLLLQQCRPLPGTAAPWESLPWCSLQLVSGPALWRGETADRAPTWSPRARQEACMEALPRRGHWTNG